MIYSIHSFLDIYPKNTKELTRKQYMYPMVTAALFKIVKIKKQCNYSTIASA